MTAFNYQVRALAGLQNNLNSVLFRGTYANRVHGQPLFTKDLNCHCIDPNKDFVLNPAAWSDPAQGQWGFSPAFYNDYRQARRYDEQLSLGRIFRIRERDELSYSRGVFQRVQPDLSGQSNFGQRIAGPAEK